MNRKFTIYSLVFASATLIIFLTGGARAQTQSDTYAFLTWHANNFYPADFEGKALPINGTTVSVTVGFVKGQKIQDPSGMPITWYLDGGVLNQGIGLNQTSFIITKTSGGRHLLRADVETSNGTFSAAVSIPVVSPETVIINREGNDGVPASTGVNLEAMPYFFNVTSFDDLIFTWLVNGVIQSEGSDNKLSISSSGQGPALVTARTTNAKNRLESDEKNVTINFSQ